MRISTHNEFETRDGARLFYRHWASPQPSNRAIVMFHRGHEHSGRLQDVVDKLGLEDFSIFAWDARGHGRSSGERGYAEDFATLTDDVDCFIAYITEQYGIAQENIVVLGHSVGSVLVTTWVLERQPKIRGLIIGSPALRVRLYIPFAIPLLRLALRIKRKLFVSSYVKARLLTHDPDKIASYEADTLITNRIAVNILVGLYDAGTRLLRNAARIKVPTLMLVSGADWVVDKTSQLSFFENLGAQRKKMHSFDGFYHDTFNEKDNHLPIGKTRQFILELFVS